MATFPPRPLAKTSVRLGLAIALAALVLAYTPEASALGKSPPPATSPAAPSAPAPAATPASKPAGAPAPAKPVPGAIAAPDIPLEADRLLTTLKGFEGRIAPKPPFLAIVNGLPDMAQRVADAHGDSQAVATFDGRAQRHAHGRPIDPRAHRGRREAGTQQGDAGQARQAGQG